MRRAAFTPIHAMYVIASATALSILILVALLVTELIQPPPQLETLLPANLTMAGPVDSGYTRAGGVFAVVPTQTANARIWDLCFMWNCGVSSEVAALRSGDRITVWMQDTRIWQMAKGDHLLLDYRVALSAHRHHLKESCIMGLVPLAAGVLLSFIGLWRDRQLRQSPTSNDL